MIWCGWGYHLFFISPDGVLNGAGMNGDGQLGVNNRQNQTLGRPVILKKQQVDDISTGNIHTILLGGSKCFTTGYGGDGRLSTGGKDTVQVPTPVLLEESVKIQGISAGMYQSYFVSIDGDVYSSGSGKYGGLGHGNEKDVLIGARIKTLKEKIGKVIGGRYMAVFLSTSSRIFLVGANHVGQLGVAPNTVKNFLVPREMTFFHDLGVGVKSVYVTEFTTYFLTEKEDVWICGGNNNNEHAVGIGVKSEKFAPVPVLSKTISGVELFAGKGNGFAVYKTKSGKVFGIGYNGHGNFGLGNTSTSVSPREIYSLEGKKIIKIACSYENCYYVSSEGELFGSGDGGCGQLLGGSNQGSYLVISLGMIGTSREEIEKWKKQKQKNDEEGSVLDDKVSMKKRMTKLEDENKVLNGRVSQMEKELESLKSETLALKKLVEQIQSKDETQ